jgi:hypothetical protein
MTRVNFMLLIFSALLALPSLAAESRNQPSASIPVFSVSPGASGSVSSSSRSINRDAQLVPGVPGGVTTRSSRVSGQSSVQQTGGIRQSIEYPNGRRVPQQSVQDDFEQRRDQ